MRIGVLILPAASWRETRECWLRADDLGFAHAWTYDHIAWRDLVGKPWYASMPTLAAAAVTTKTIRLGTLVSSPNFRHPVPFAKEVMTLDDLSGGRFILGLGAGTAGPDAQVLGGETLSPRERTDRFAEFVELTDLLLRQPVTDFTGRYYQAADAWVDPSGRQRSKVPLAISATGPRGMRLAARHGDIWVTNGMSAARGLAAPAASPALVREQIQRLRSACDREQRNPADIRTLLLNVNRVDPPLSSIEAFRDAVGQYAEVGVTDLVVPYPRREPPFVGDLDVLEAVAAEFPSPEPTNTRSE